MRKFRRLAKTHQPFSAVSGPKFTKFGACRGVPVDRHVFPIVDIMFRCRGMLDQNSKSVPKSVFVPQLGGKCPGSSDQIFQIAVISEYVSQVWGKI